MFIIIDLCEKVSCRIISVVEEIKKHEMSGVRPKPMIKYEACVCTVRMC